MSRPAPRYPFARRALLTAEQRRAWARWPRIGHDVDALAGGADPYDPAAWFGRTAPLVLEIADGTGESTVEMAAAAPDVDHLVLDAGRADLAELLIRIDEAGLRNVVPLRGDAVTLLRDVLPPDGLDAIRVYFPDPGHVRRDHRRRLVDPSFIALAAGRLRPGGTLHLATDLWHYAFAMRSAGATEPRLVNTADEAEDQIDGFVRRDDRRPETGFDRRAALLRRAVRDLVYRRR